MASAAEPSRSTRPLPTGWSDSSGDDRNAKGDGAMSVEGAGGGGGGGFDTDSSDGGWCGRGGGLRDFEQASAENTRRALLRNDAQLCEPPPLPSPPDGHQQQQQQQQQQQRREPPLRFVPGDPFAKEEADVGAWARHFTYLAVVPSGTVFSKTLEPPGSAETEPETERGAGAGAEVEVAAEAGLRSRFGEKGGASVSSSTVAVPAAAGRAAALVSPVAAAAAASTQGGEEEEEKGDDEENERRQEGQGREGGVLEEKEEGEEEEGEVVYASHGVYEEYLAYDCRPPGSDEIDRSQGLVAEEGADSAATTAAAAAAAAAAAREGQGRCPNATQKGDCGASRPRPGTPQRELRQEIMDRLFDEVWERLTPDLVLLLELDASAGAGGGGGTGQPGERKHPESFVGGGGGGGAGARVPVAGDGSGGFATEFGRNDEGGFRRDSMET